MYYMIMRNKSGGDPLQQFWCQLRGEWTTFAKASYWDSKIVCEIELSQIQRQGELGCVVVR